MLLRVTRAGPLVLLGLVACARDGRALRAGAERSTDAGGERGGPAGHDAGVEGGVMTEQPAQRVFTFADDLDFLKAHGEIIVLSSSQGARVAVSPKYQGRVMTSGIGDKGPSFGWINRAFIESEKTGTQFDNYGGEDRFWLGPEGGQYGLYFAPGQPFAFDAWQTPHDLQEGTWAVAERAADRVVLKKSLRVKNWSGTEFLVDVERTVRMLEDKDLKASLGVSPDNSNFWGHGSFVGFETKNRIVNAGKAPLRKETGLVSIWILSMLTPTPDTRVIVPYRVDAPAGVPIVNDGYFGPIPPDRLRVHEDLGCLTFTCDGKQRGKIGLVPERAKDVLGSFGTTQYGAASGGRLTVVQYEGRKVGAPYVNSMWERQKEPYRGDVINSYNDGPPAPGKPPLGGFYELETSSPGAELAPGQALVHTQRTFHFEGLRSYVEQLGAQVLLGRRSLPLD
jgi:hypothetical protein